MRANGEETPIIIVFLAICSHRPRPEHIIHTEISKIKPPNGTNELAKHASMHGKELARGASQLGFKRKREKKSEWVFREKFHGGLIGWKSV